MTASDPGSRALPRLARLIPDGNLAGSLYGTVLVTSVLATFDGSEPAGFVIAAVLVTTVVFELAHAWANALAASGAARRHLDTQVLGRSIRHEASIVEAALPATLVLLLAAVGLYSTGTALWVAALLNLGLLFTWGVGLSQLAGGTSRQALVAGLGSASLGLVLIALKVLVH